MGCRPSANCGGALPARSRGGIRSQLRSSLLLQRAPTNECAILEIAALMRAVVAAVVFIDHADEIGDRRLFRLTHADCVTRLVFVIVYGGPHCPSGRDAG